MTLLKIMRSVEKRLLQANGSRELYTVSSPSVIWFSRTPKIWKRNMMSCSSKGSCEMHQVGRYKRSSLQMQKRERGFNVPPLTTYSYFNNLFYLCDFNCIGNR